MHMSDALLSPAVGAAFWAGSVGTVAYCAKKLKENTDDKLVPLMGVLGAFIFAAQMINFTIPGTGSSGHIGGGMILAILLGPHAAFLATASVLTIQSLFFADGGIFALGCNIWNLGIYPCFIAYPLIYKKITRGDSSKSIFIASILSVVIGLQLGAFSVVLQTVFSGKSELPFNAFVYMMLPIHFAIGIVEGFITAGVVNYVKKARPEILESVPVAQPLSRNISIKKIFIAFAILTVIVGGALSWFASEYPDGLEWSIEKVYGKPELPEQENKAASALKNVQDKTAFLPDYSIKTESDSDKEPVEDSGKWPNIDKGTSLSGIVGSLMVLVLITGVWAATRIVKRRKRA